MLSKQFCKASFHKLTPEQRVVALGNMLAEEMVVMQHPAIMKSNIIPINIEVQVFDHQSGQIGVGDISRGRSIGTTTTIIQEYVRNWADHKKEEKKDE